jgi:hypothetical protein
MNAPFNQAAEAPESSTPSCSSQQAGAANAAALYARISADTELTQTLFRQALQDPSGALDRIVALGQELNLPVSREQVRAHVASLDDPASKQWLLKARGGL